MRLAGCLVWIVLLVGRPAWTPVVGQNIATHTLPNGLECAYWPDTTRLLSHVSITLRGGPLLDPPDADGLANLHGHLLARRSDSLPGDGGLLDAVRRNGLAFRQATLAEGNFFMMSALPPDLAQGMAVLAAAIRYPGYNEEGLDQVRAEVAKEIQFLEGRPEYYHEEALRERLWRRQAHMKNISGSYIQLAALKLNWIRDYISIYLHPHQVLLAGTGRMAPEEFFRLADSLLGDWKWGQTGPDAPQVKFPGLDAPVYFVTENAFAAAPVLTMAWPVEGTRMAEQANYPGLVTQFGYFAAMANLKQGRFYRSLVGSGLAREAGWHYSPSLAPGQMVLRVVPDPDSLVACLEAVRDALRAMGEPGYFREADMDAAQRVLKLRTARRNDQSADRLAELGQHWVRGRLREGEQQEFRPHPQALEQIAKRFSPEKPHVAGLMHNLRIDLLAGLEGIFRAGTAVAAVEETDPTTAVETAPDSAMSLTHLSDFRIYFESASFRPDGPSLLALDTVAEMLHTYPDLRLYLNGYADGQGDGVFNYKLSIERARSVKAVLSSAHQLDPDRLLVRPFGEAFPEWPDDTPEHRALNRRVTFNIAPPDATEHVF